MPQGIHLKPRPLAGRGFSFLSFGPNLQPPPLGVFCVYSRLRFSHRAAVQKTGEPRCSRWPGLPVAALRCFFVWGAFHSPEAPLVEIISNKQRRSAPSGRRLSCRTFAANAVRLQLHALVYNLGNFLHTLATPEPIKDWSLTTLKDKLIKIGAKVVSHGRYVVFQMAEVAIARQMFQEILRLIAELRPQPPPAPA